LHRWCQRLVSLQLLFESRLKSPNQFACELAKFNIKKISQVLLVATLTSLNIANIPMWFREHNNKQDGGGFEFWGYKFNRATTLLGFCLCISYAEIQADSADSGAHEQKRAYPKHRHNRSH
jgi:hypothetical protein